MKEAEAELQENLRRVVSCAQAMQQHVAGLNEPPAGVDLASILRFADLCVEVVESVGDDLRDNLLATYALASRPDLDGDASYSHLLLDKILNDTRDALIAAEKSAEAAGRPSPARANPIPKQLLVPISDIESEFSQIKGQMNEISAEISALRVSGNQLGVFNINIEQLKVKADIAQAIIGIRKLLDALNLHRVFNGIADSSARMLGLAADVTGPLRSIVGSALRKISDAAVSAVQVVSGIVAKFSAPDLNDGEIWTESEVRDMLSSGREVPRAAAPFIRNLHFGFPEDPDIRQLSKLTELRALSLDLERSEQDLSSLGSLTKLRKLSIELPNKSDIYWVNSLVNLEELDVYCNYSGRFLATLPEELMLPKLKILKIRNLVTDFLPDLSRCSSLHDVDLRRIDVDDFESLANASSIRALTISRCKVSDFGFLASLQDVETLDLRHTPLRDLSSTCLMPSLQTILISRRYATSSIVSRINLRARVLGDYEGLIRSSRRQ